MSNWRPAWNGPAPWKGGDEAHEHSPKVEDWTATRYAAICECGATRFWDALKDEWLVGKPERLERRELRAPQDECPKCGTFPQPKWRCIGATIVEQGGDGPFPKFTSAEHEHLFYECPCGYSWEGPPRDA